MEGHVRGGGGSDCSTVLDHAKQSLLDLHAAFKV